MSRRGSKILSIVQKTDQLKHPRDHDTSKTKRTKSTGSQGRSQSVPLRAWPNCGGKSVPDILGLDKYPYDVGTRLYARAETKFSQQIAEEVRLESIRDVPGGLGHKKFSSGEHGHVEEPPATGECFVEAGRQGSAAILWNRTGYSTDGSKAQLRKRRQKLTDDVLKGIVVSYGEPLKVVSSWFSVFEFYCDPPVDHALPPLPETQDDTVLDNPQEFLRPRSATRCTRGFSMSSLFGGPRSDSQPAASCQRLLRPRLRQAPGKQGPRGELNDELWHRRCKELGKFKPPSLCGQQICVGDLDLERKCKREYLDSDKLEHWAKAYDEAVYAADHIGVAINVHGLGLTAARRIVPDLDEELAGCTKVQTHVQKMKENFFFGLASLAQAPDEGPTRTAADNGSSAASARSDGDNGSSAVSSSAASDGWAEACIGTEYTSRELMLRTASKTLLNSKLLQKAKTGKREKVQQKSGEVLAERARILQGMLPVEMTPDNLFRSLSLFGLVQRKACMRIYEFLLKGGRCSTQLKYGDGLCFEVFLQLMRPLLGGNKLKSAQPSSRSKSGMSGSHDRPNPWEAPAFIDERAWTGSDLLLRLVFSLLTDRAACRPEHAAARRDADQTGVPFSERVLADSLRLFLSAHVLLEVDRGSICAEHLSSISQAGEELTDDEFPSMLYDDSSSATGSKGSNANGAQLRPSAELSENRFASTLFTSLVEGLHSDLTQAQADVSATPDECVSTTPQSVLSFRAFEHWVSKSPGLYTALLHLLLPLLPYGVALTSEELEFAARGLTQRCGELRARSEVRAQGIQRKRFMKLHAYFANRCL